MTSVTGSDPYADLEGPWPDEAWLATWEGALTGVERHALAVAVVRDRPPVERFDWLIARELIRRWRRRALGLLIPYGLWTLFWGSLLVRDLRLDRRLDHGLPVALTAVGITAMLACLVAHRVLAQRFRPRRSPRRSGRLHESGGGVCHTPAVPGGRRSQPT